MAIYTKQEGIFGDYIIDATDLEPPKKLTTGEQLTGEQVTGDHDLPARIKSSVHNSVCTMNDTIPIQQSQQAMPTGECIAQIIRGEKTGEFTVSRKVYRQKNEQEKGRITKGAFKADSIDHPESEEIHGEQIETKPGHERISMNISRFVKMVKRTPNEIEEMLILFSDEKTFEHFSQNGIEENVMITFDLKRILTFFCREEENRQDTSSLSFTADDIKKLGIKFELKTILELKINSEKIKELIANDLIEKGAIIKLLYTTPKKTKLLTLLKRFGFSISQVEATELKLLPPMLTDLKRAGILINT